MFRGKLLNVIAAATLLTNAGCASIISGTTDDVVVETNPPAASCVIEQDGKTVGKVDPTPGTALVPRSAKDLVVTCTKPGFDQASATNERGTNPWMFGNLVFFLAGFVGATIDVITGAASDYDHVTTVTLARAAPAVAADVTVE